MPGMKKTMDEWKSGTLKSSSGAPVKSQKQAIAIGRLSSEQITTLLIRNPVSNPQGKHGTQRRECRNWKRLLLLTCFITVDLGKWNHHESARSNARYC